VTIVTSKDPTERQLAMLRVYNRELFVELARHEENPEVRRTTILLLDDREEIERPAVAPQAAVREAAVMGLEDESFLLARIHAREESSPTVRSAIVGALRTQAGLSEAAQTAYYGDVRKAAAERVTEPALAAKVRAAQVTITAEAQRLGGSDASTILVEEAIRGAFDAVSQAAAKRLTNQTDLAAVALAANDRDVLKIVLGKLDDPARLKQVAESAADAPMRLAAARKAGARTWRDIFASAAGRTAESRTALGDALAAVSLFGAVQSEAQEAVQQACLAMIRKGDESRIPEMIDLLGLYGDKRLAEDYLNCGQPDLENAGTRWAHARGYNVGRGAGSNRARWGSGR
jgi:hypothetical protein